MMHMFSQILLLLLTYQLAQVVGVLLQEADYSSCVNNDQSQRTMFNIIWGCLSTTIICAWTAIHPNLQTRESPLKRTLRKFELMVWTIVAPEILPCWALNQQLAARTVRDVYNDGKGYQEERYGIWKTLKRWVSLSDITETENPAWTLKHGHFVIMGGIHLVEPVDSDGSLTSPEASVGTDQTVQPTALSSIQTDTESGSVRPATKPKVLTGRVTILTVETLRELVKDPEFEVSVTEEEIMDKSKGDALSKIIFILQSSWFILQCIARGIQGLKFTQLEVTTLALASLNGITFILWWDKPLGAQTPVSVYLKRELTDAERNAGQNNTFNSARSDFILFIKRTYGRATTKIRDILLCRSGKTPLVDLLISLPLCVLFLLIPFPIIAFASVFFATFSDMLMASSFPADAIRVPTFYVPKHRYSEYWHLLLFLVLGPLFGGIHCAGWNFDFPTYAKQQLWRSASLILTTIPIGVPAILFVILAICSLKNAIIGSTHFVPPRLYEINSLSVLTTLLFTFLYATARMILLGLAIALLRNQPSSVLTAVNWPYPHVR